MTKVNPEAELAAKLVVLAVPADRETPATPHQAAFDAARLCSLARAHHRLAETECNREMTTRELARQVNIRLTIREILVEYGIESVNFSGDPRGYTVKIHFPDGRGNTWGGDSEGWGI